MNILHISDLHYNEASARVSEKVIVKVADSIKTSGKKLDYVLFTGDLVFSATIKSHFEAARQQLFDYISKELNVNPQNIIFCPGNHDIDRGSKHRAVRPYFKDEVTTLKELNDFYSSKNEVSEVSHTLRSS